MLRPSEKKNLVCPSQIRKGFSLGAFVAAIFISSTLSSSHAAELAMFEQAGCGWCETFDREIAPIYPKTAEGQRAPLRRVSIDHPVPSDLAFIEIERLAPVFVLVHNGQEIGVSVVIQARIISGDCLLH